MIQQEIDQYIRLVDHSIMFASDIHCNSREVRDESLGLPRCFGSSNYTQTSSRFSIFLLSLSTSDLNMTANIYSIVRVINWTLTHKLISLPVSRSASILILSIFIKI